MCDDFDIRTLPANFVSISKPSKVIEKLKEKRKSAHDAALQAMKIKKREVNIEVDNKIKNQCDITKNELKRLKEEMEDFLLNLGKKEEHDFNIEENLITIAIEKISYTNKLQTDLVENFYEALVTTEKNRTDKFKFIFKDTKELLLIISHQLPFQIGELFEKEILDMNQISINNFHHYSELEKDLKLQIRNDMKIWTENLYEIKEKLKKFLKNLAFKSAARLQSMMKTNLDLCKSADLTKEINKMKSLHDDLRWQFSHESRIPVEQVDVEIWLKDVQQTLAYLDQSAKNIVTLYKSMIIILFNRFFGELEDLKKSMKDSGIVNKRDIEEFQSEIYTPTIDEMNIQLEKDFNKLQLVWGEAIINMKISVNETYACLKGAASLWDRHFERVNDLGRLIVRDVENTVEKNSHFTEAFETKLGILIERLRQASNEKQMKKYLEEIKNILLEIENTYAAHRTSEIQVVQKYKTTIEVEIDVLMAEIKRFLTLHPPDEERDPKKQRKRASQISEIHVDPNEALLPMQILYCIFQVDAVKNWMFGLWESINQYLTVGKGEILLLADEWIKVQTEKINERLMVKLAFHKPRYESVKFSIYMKRLQELNTHLKRFISHKTAAENEVKSLKALQQSNEGKFVAIFDAFNNEAEKMLKEVKIADKSSQIRSYSLNQQSNFQKHQNNLNDVLKEYLCTCNDFIQNLKFSDYQFLKAVKLFSEGGNFNIEEANTLEKNLSKLETQMVKQVEILINEGTSMFTRYEYKLQSKQAELLATMEELIKEHEHNEKTVRKIKNIQDDIRKEIVNLRVKFKTIDGNLKKLMKYNGQDMGDYECLASFSDMLQKTVTEIVDFVSYLFHPEPIVLYTAVTSGTGEGIFGGKIKNEKHRNYSTVLFGYITEKTDFISKLNMLLYESLEDIQQDAKEFYSRPHQFLLSSSKIQYNYDDFMGEVMKKYKNFLIQYELFWLENITEIRTCLNDFQNYKIQYLKIFADTFYRKSHTNCQATVKNILKQISEGKTETENGFKLIYDKLKVLYGHPSNTYLLDSIEMEFNNLLNQNEEKFARILNPFKETIINVNEEIKGTFAQVQQQLTKLSEDNRVSSIVNKIGEQMDEKIKLMMQLVENDRQSNDGSDNYIEQQSVSKHIISYLKNQTTAIIPKREIFESVTPCSLSTVSIYDNPEDFLKELEFNCEMNMKKISEFADIQLFSYIENLKNIWANEVKNIRELYQVKYDKNDENVN